MRDHDNIGALYCLSFGTLIGFGAGIYLSVEAGKQIVDLFPKRSLLGAVTLTISSSITIIVISTVIGRGLGNCAGACFRCCDYLSKHRCQN